MALEEADQARVDELAKRASSAFAESDLGQVRQLYGQVLELDPAHPAANYWLGYLECREGRPENGVNYLQTATESALACAEWLAPDSLVELGMALNSLGQAAEADEQFATVLQRFSNYADGQLALAEDLGDDEHLVESAIDACHRGLLVNGQHPGLLKKTAELLEQEERWDEAADFWGHLAAQSAPQANLHVKMGIAWQRHGDAGTAREEFGKALVIDPEHEAATFALVQLLDEQGEPEEIIPRLERLAKAKPDSARVALALANYLRQYERLTEAID